LAGTTGRNRGVFSEIPSTAASDQLMHSHDLSPISRLLIIRIMASLPHSLKPAARSAYRAVLRSARITFDGQPRHLSTPRNTALMHHLKGDPPRRLALQTAVRQTLSSPTLSTHGQASTSSPTASSSNTSEATEVEQSKRIEEWLEVALFLRRNVVQGVQEEEGAFRESQRRSVDLSKLSLSF